MLHDLSGPRSPTVLYSFKGTWQGPESGFGITSGTGVKKQKMVTGKRKKRVRLLPRLGLGISVFPLDPKKRKMGQTGFPLGWLWKGDSCPGLMGKGPSLGRAKIQAVWEVTSSERVLRAGMERDVVWQWGWVSTGLKKQAHVVDLGGAKRGDGEGQTPQPFERR
jgi:hypothetical protein